MKGVEVTISENFDGNIPYGKHYFAKGAYVLTFKEKDGANDSSSNLSLGNRYRLNLKISKETFFYCMNLL